MTRLQDRSGTVVGAVAMRGEFEIAVTGPSVRSPIPLTYLEASLPAMVDVLGQIAPRLVVVLIDSHAAIELAARLAAARLPVALLLEQQLGCAATPRAVAAARLGRNLPPREVIEEAAQRLNRFTTISLAAAAAAFGVAAWPVFPTGRR